ncbi:MAG: heavy metal-associated domain-containing protein [Synechococcales bacterium]|nr:heavy metal-associated domain-containing protein [Synechococcales bacterium]
MDTVILKVGGMVCDGCAANVERTIAEIAGVSLCTVSYASHQATVQYHPHQVDLSTIRRLVEEVGFTVQPL